jgi:hypothetical protein
LADGVYQSDLHFGVASHPEYETPIGQRLDPGEQLLWIGRPTQGRRFGIVGIALSILGTAATFAGLWITRRQVGQALRAEEYVDAVLIFLFGVSVSLLGLIPIVNLLWLDSRRRDQTFYGLTDRRAILVRGLRHRRTRSLDLRSAINVTLNRHRDGTGTISFSPPPPLWRVLIQTRGSRVTPALPAFDHIQDADEVLALIHSAQQGQEVAAL